MGRTVFYKSGTDEVEAYMVEPEKPKGCVVVLHEVWGLVQHIKKVCKRLGKLGFTVVAPNLYTNDKSLLTPERIRKAMEGLWGLSLEERRDIGKVREAMTQKQFPDDIIETASVLYDTKFRDKLVLYTISAIKYAHNNYGSVSALGFCMGGGILGRAATRSKELNSAIVFYGEPPPADKLDSLRVPLLLIYAAHDNLINSKVPQFIQRAFELGKEIMFKIYPETSHGFFNEDNRRSYSKEAAEDAWELTKWFLSRTLG